MKQNAILDAALARVNTDCFFSEEQLQRDADYYRAERITKSMLNQTRGLFIVVRVRNHAFRASKLLCAFRLSIILYKGEFWIGS